MDLKKMAAFKAAELVIDRSSVGVGGGSTVLYLCELLKEKIDSGYDINLFTSSPETRKFLLHRHLPVSETASIARLDIYFDGCDQFDASLSALKSGGGIHTQEKLLAGMADEFVLVGDLAKRVDQFSPSLPLVLEIIPESLGHVQDRVHTIFHPQKMAVRFDVENEKPVKTINGNLLLDIWFDGWPALESINPPLKKITGVLESSLFFKMAAKAVMGTDRGAVVLVKTE